MSDISVIGLGPMGSALAGAFLSKGCSTTVWNRTARKADFLVSKGASLAATACEAVCASTLVVVCVADYDAVHKIIDPLADALAGRALVNLSSGTYMDADLGHFRG